MNTNEYYIWVLINKTISVRELRLYIAHSTGVKISTNQTAPRGEWSSVIFQWSVDMYTTCWNKERKKKSLLFSFHIMIFTGGLISDMWPNWVFSYN